MKKKRLTKDKIFSCSLLLNADFLPRDIIPRQMSK